MSKWLAGLAVNRSELNVGRRPRREGIRGNLSWVFIAGLLFVAAEATAAKQVSPKKDWELVRSVSSSYGGVDLVLVPERKKRDRNYYATIGRAVCGERTECAVMFWTDRAHVPNSANMLIRDLRERTASYEVSPSFKEPILRLACWLYRTREIGERMNCFYMPGRTYWEQEKK
jgi:hypothetical protein